MTDLRVNYTTDTKYCKVASQKLKEQLILLKNLRIFRVMRDKIVLSPRESIINDIKTWYSTVILIALYYNFPHGKVSYF